MSNAFLTDLAWIAAGLITHPATDRQRVSAAIPANIVRIRHASRCGIGHETSIQRAKGHVVDRRYAAARKPLGELCTDPHRELSRASRVAHLVGTETTNPTTSTKCYATIANCIVTSTMDPLTSKRT